MFEQRSRRYSTLATAVLLCLVAATPSSADVTPYNQDFESLVQSDPDALANNGWLVYGNVYNGTTGFWMYGYGAFTAPNDGAAFCAIDIGQGGPPQGDQQLSIYSDYNNFLEHQAGNLVEANVYQERVIGAGDVGRTYAFSFDAKLGNIEGNSTAQAFIKTIDPNNNYWLSNLVSEDMTNIPVTWQRYTLLLYIDAGLVGQYFQIGFMNTATNSEGSGIFYDNIVLREATTAGVPSAPAALELHQNEPNPFNPMTRIRFDLRQADMVDLSIYDAAGRYVTTLFRGHLDSGPHSMTWNGRTPNGPAATGVYRYVLKTPTSRVARSMVLVK